jgi:hypothetical protein
MRIGVTEVQRTCLAYRRAIGPMSISPSSSKTSSGRLSSICKGGTGGSVEPQATDSFNVLDLFGLWVVVGAMIVLGTVVELVETIVSKTEFGIQKAGARRAAKRKEEEEMESEMVDKITRRLSKQIKRSSIAGTGEMEWSMENSMARKIGRKEREEEMNI